MTKYEFLGDLSRLLSDIPDEERIQAMKYYEDYFADAGDGHEQEVLQELGSPEDIAKLIKSDMPENIEYGEGSSSRMQDCMQPYHPSAQGGQSRNEHKTQFDNKEFQKESTPGAGSSILSDSGKNVVLIVILAIITSPIWGTVLLGIISLIVGILSAILGILAGLILGGGGVAIGGFASVFGGAVACVTGNVASGILTIGIGCVLFPVGVLCCYLGVMLCVKLIPAVWQELVKGVNWCSRKLNQIF